MAITDPRPPKFMASGFALANAPRVPVEYELRPRGRRPAWKVEQALRDGKRQGFACAPAGYGRRSTMEWYHGESSVIGVRGRLASQLFNAAKPYALADVNMFDWVERYGAEGLEGYPFGEHAPDPQPNAFIEQGLRMGEPSPRGYIPGVGWPYPYLPPRVPFFIPIEAVPPGRRVATLKNGMRYVVPEGVGEVVGEVVPRG